MVVIFMMIKDNLEFYDIDTTSSRNQAVDIYHRDTYHFDQDSPYSITKCIKWYTTMPGRTEEDTCSIYTVAFISQTVCNAIADSGLRN